ncbi:FecCD family ABC transporter permease [Microbacterium sp. 179-B 1A2 NHS]|uniref:FecCD family ABC transporter permease n=1 Tax=Microbacterium sp. 179-B 1A2 NHS TaxID=3142383 RepID=UPI0039A1BEDC
MSTTALRTSPPDAASLRRPAAVRLAWLGALAALILVLVGASVALGVRGVSLDDIIAGLGGSTGTVSEAAVVSRLPRTALAVLAGAALALSGAAIQAVTRNPLGDPGILGITSGASLAVVIGIAFFAVTNPYVTLTLAVVGSAGAAVFVYAIGSLGTGGATPLKLALAGAATAAALSSLVSAILLPRVDVLENFRFWQIGGVSGATWDRIAVVLPVLAVGALICLATARGMNSLALGDDLAASLGEHVGRTRALAALGAVILCGTATAVTGPIAFVGLVVPHFCRMLVGTDHRWLLPFSALAGSALLLGADVIGRLVARPGEVPVGIVTAVIGAPFFIWLLRRRRVREL